LIKIAQWIFLGFVGYYVYHYISSTSIKLDFSFKDFTRLISENWVLSLTLLLLSPLNSLVEAKKWQVAILHIAPKVTIGRSLKMIYVGAAAGLITPSKIGEYGGRLIDIPAQSYPQAIVANFYCSLSQNLTNLIIGFTAIVVLSNQLYGQFQFITISLVTMGGISSLVLLILYFNLPRFTRVFGKISFLKKWLTSKEIKYESKVHVDTILRWAFLRYAIYLLQYLLVVEILNFEIGWLEKLGAIGIIFLLQSVVVLPSLLGIVARVEIAFFVWASVGMINGDVLMATLFLWVVNLALPATLGAIWLLLDRQNLNEKYN
jgi:Lysylphosphatidylglycerol synthase TM region